jgi:hypothetical protein
MAEETKPAAIAVQVAAIIADLDDLLDRERRALLDGDLEAVTRCLREKERLIDILVRHQLPDDAGTGVVRDKAARNQILLDGALEGIRAVADRIATMRRIRDTLETYDHTGRKTAVEGFRPGQMEKRA